MTAVCLQVIMSQYAKVGEMQNKRLQKALDPIFGFRSAESETLLEATLESCRRLHVYNEIFLQINEECDQATQPTEQPNDPEPIDAPAPEPVDAPGPEPVQPEQMVVSQLASLVHGHAFSGPDHQL